MSIWPFLFVALFAQTFLLSLLLVPVARRIGPRLGMADRPGPRKIHAHVIPRSGGLAVVLSFILCLLVDLALAWWIGREAAFLPPRVRTLCSNLVLRLAPLAAILGGALVVFSLGVADDIFSLGPRLKLAVQFLAVLPLLAAGVTVKLFLPAPWMGWILTALWVVAITNSFNLLDNMDGLCGGVAMIACGVMTLISLLAGEFYMAAMFLLLAGALAGFLRYNWNPATVFLGDAGSLTIGYLIASLMVVATYYKPGVPTALPVLMPIVVLGVPLFDTLSVLWIRWRRGKPLMVGDTNHFSHRLVRLGMTVRGAVAFIYLTTAAMGLAALPLRHLPLPEALVQAAFIGLLFLLIYLLEQAGARREESNPH